MTRQERKARTFHSLHTGDPFIIPNPWDVGSAKVLEALGFKALATTSSGFAFTLGRPDGQARLEEVIEHVRSVDAATELPVSVDLENGHGRSPEAAARAIALAAQAGAAGGSIEDFDREAGIVYELAEAVDRVRAAVEAARHLAVPFVLTARAENFIRDRPDLGDTIARLQAFEAAGADVLFAPGLRTPEEIRSVRRSVSRPLNVLARPNMTFGQIVEAGAQRVSVGGRLTWVAVKAMIDAVTTVRDTGDFSVLAAGSPPREWLTR